MYGEVRNEIESIKKDKGSFALVGTFNGISEHTALVGVYETCAGKAGTFLMFLKTNQKSQSEIVQLRKFENTFFAFLMPVSNNSIMFADCYGCGGNTIYTWTGREYGENVVLKGGSVCLNKSVIYSAENEDSTPVLKTSKREEVKVLGIGLRKGEFFWHQIKFDSGQTGFVLNSSFDFQPGDCI